MKTTHTPGPWHYVDCGEGLHAIHDQPDKRGRHEQLATVYTKDNARLIAAAPELLAALEELVLRCDGEEGVRADGSNIQTMRAHAILEKIGGEHE